MNEELIEKCRKEYYELNDFKHLSPMAKGGCKDLFYENIEPIIQFVISLISAEARKRERERLLKLLPEIGTRFHYNKTCFDCVENIKREALKESSKEAE